MWILSCDGELFGGKRLWLRPGSTHLLGRTSGRPEKGERIRFIDHKSVSRKHLIIRVGDVDARDASSLHKRTGITLEDGSKVGTFLNGERFTKETRTLNGSKKEYVLRLGQYQSAFHLVWQPVTLTFTSVKKGKGDALAAQRELLVGTDVKLLTEYVSNETTHVVGKKRNLPFGLQALLQARWVVTFAWVDALAKATQREGTDANGDLQSSALEEDFDGHWPKEDGYVVPAGGEPQPRPDELMKPKPERAEVFQDFIFVFLSQGQHDTLLPVITTGGGKALCREAEVGETSAYEIANYVKEVAGKKGDDQFRLSQQTGRGGVVVVRLPIAKGDEQARQFQRSVDFALDQRSIEQNTFLDMILTVDTSGLRTQLPESQSEPSGSIRAPVSPPRSPPRREQPAMDEAERPVQQPPTSAQPENEDQVAQESVVTKKRNRRLVTQSRYKDFDDPDPSQDTRRASPEPEPSVPSFRELSQAPSVQSVDMDDPSQSIRTQQSNRKRPAPVDDEPEEEVNIYESMFPGQAALKRRKTEAARNEGSNSFSKAAIEVDRAATEKAAKVKKRKEKQVDVKAELKARRDREEEQRRKDDESLREQMEGVDIGELRNLAKVEEMEVPFRERPSRQANGTGRSERWDPAWNGRKNFKKFRPQGQRNDVPRLQRVIVTLEEVPRKGHGIGDEYWLTSTAASGKSKSKSQSQSQTVRADPSSEDTGDAARFRRRIQHSREEDAEEAVHNDVHPAEIAGHARDPELEALANGEPSQTLGTESQRKAAGKRPAMQQGGGPAKKAKQTTLPARNTNAVNLEDDDDDDGLKFKRRRR